MEPLSPLSITPEDIKSFNAQLLKNLDEDLLEIIPHPCCLGCPNRKVNSHFYKYVEHLRNNRDPEEFYLAHNMTRLCCRLYIAKPQEHQKGQSYYDPEKIKGRKGGAVRRQYTSGGGDIYRKISMSNAAADKAREMNAPSARSAYSNGGNDPLLSIQPSAKFQFPSPNSYSLPSEMGMIPQSKPLTFPAVGTLPDIQSITIKSTPIETPPKEKTYGRSGKQRVIGTRSVGEGYVVEELSRYYTGLRIKK